MNDDLLERFQTLIAARTGLQVRDKDRGALITALDARRKTLRLATAESYYQTLATAREDGEWRLLLPYLTNGESYFLRDKGQFALLRHHLLPELIERRSETRSLRVWSAGCSTGEEPYSLALLLDELLPPTGWKVSILGTDINEQSLQKARRAVYSSWSFRSVEPEIRARYFHAVRDGFELDARIRQKVSFQHVNLGSEGFPDSAPGLRDMDLIVCRNVLIYFQRAAVGRVVSGFTQALREGGFLLTGHAELHDQSVAPLRSRVFAESLAYQKPDVAESLQPTGSSLKPERPPLKQRAEDQSPLKRANAQCSTPAKRLMQSRLGGLWPQPAASAAGVPASSLTLLAKTAPAPQLDSANSALDEAELLLRRGESERALSLLERQPQNELFASALCLKARAHANLGQHAAAIECCRRATQADATFHEAYFVWAQVEEELGQAEAAKTLLKKVIYLAPSDVHAFLELGAIYEREGDAARARRMRESALDLLRALPPQLVVASPMGEMTAANLVQDVARMLGNPASNQNVAGGRTR